MSNHKSSDDKQSTPAKVPVTYSITSWDVSKLLDPQKIKNSVNNDIRTLKKLKDVA